MKFSLFSLLVLSSFVVTGCSDQESHIKNLWYAQNVLLDSEFSVDVKTIDFNGDGQKDWYTESDYNCGSQGCVYELWSEVNGDLCMVGKWSADIRKLKYNGELQCNTDIFLDMESYPTGHANSNHKEASGLSYDDFQIEAWVTEDASGNPLMKATTIEITPLTEVSITNVLANRGNCKPSIFTARKFPIQAQWSQTFEVHYGCGNSKLLEVTLETERGNLTYSLN